MEFADDFSQYYKSLLEGQYNCVDRIVLNGYFPLGQQGGGFRHWWKQLTGSDETLTQDHLQRMAGRFSRRVHGFAKKKNIPIIHCKTGERKHLLVPQYQPADQNFKGLFLILVAKAPALVWEAKRNMKGALNLERKAPWPYVNHYHFHIIDPDWGHITIKMSGHPPFGIQIILNGHEWVERQARKQTVSQILKEGNCFVGGSDFQALNQIADALCDHHAIGRLNEVCDRWVYSCCLCFGLDTQEQEKSGFRYRYSCYQLEYSRNLLFVRGRMLDAVYQGLIDRTRRTLNVDRLKTIFGRKARPAHREKPGKKPPRFECVIDESAYDLTVFKVHFGRLTLKVYDKGARVLRVEAVAHNVKDLRCGKILEKLSIMLEKLQRMAIDFLNVLKAAHISYLNEKTLDNLHQPTQRGSSRLAGINLQNPRMRNVCEALLHLAPKPGGFTCAELTEQVQKSKKGCIQNYNQRQASYDLRKLRGKGIVEPIPKTRKYRCSTFGIETISALIILREKIIRPILAGLVDKKVGRPPKNMQPIDKHYINLRNEMRLAFETLGIAA